MTNALTITNLHKIYPNGLQALKGVNLNIQSGDFFALLGANGAGKSTTIGIISSLVNKTSGEVQVHGHCLDKDPMAIRSLIGLVPQEFNFSIFEIVEEIIINQAGYYGISRKEATPQTHKLLKQLDLWDKRHVMAQELSGGMKRRLMIARALVHKPQLLILDEPTAGVDIEIRRSMWEFLKELNQQGTTIILTTHYLEEAESLCNNIAIIAAGKTLRQTSMKTLLSELQQESFVLDIEPINTFNAIQTEGYNIQRIDEHTLELHIDKHATLNDVFEKLSKENIVVHSMRNKTNRLEQLFLHSVDGGK